MNNNCELCGGKYDFRMVQIDECLNMTGIAFSGSKRQVNNDNRFRFCPKCGRELTKENFGGVNFDDQSDMREKIKEYICELDTEIKRCGKKRNEYNKEDDEVGEFVMHSRLQALTEVKNNLQSILDEVI